VSTYPDTAAKAGRFANLFVWSDGDVVADLSAISPALSEGKAGKCDQQKQTGRNPQWNPKPHKNLLKPNHRLGQGEGIMAQPARIICWFGWPISL
jgi:hypothetical protein